MERSKRYLSLAITGILSIGTVFAAANILANENKIDFGSKIQKKLYSKSEKLFGINTPITNSATATTGDYRTETQTASDQIKLARGLKTEYLTRHAANKTDMLTFWPTIEFPSHLITCVEGKREGITTSKYNPSIQRINLETGAVSTILRGMNGCDGIRRTPWGSILATEEKNDGNAYELINPLTTTEQTVIDRSTGNVTDPANIARRDMLPTMSWEGLTILENGVVIAGDELRPGSGTLGTDGGAIFKFVPTTLNTGMDKITNLDDSPLVSGSVYAMTTSCREKSSSNFPQYGQGCEIGQGAWVEVNAANARAEANMKGATGHYRPEDLHQDFMYSGNGVRFCWTNTGRESAENYGEVICAIDNNPDATQIINDARTNYNYLATMEGQYATFAANRFVEGDPDFNSIDNLAFQPKTGNLYVIEDHPNGDIFACLSDGADRDIKTDGCVKILSVKDSSAEPTGFLFAADGKTAYLSIQHSNDGNMPLYDDYKTDDVLKITGFKIHN